MIELKDIECAANRKQEGIEELAANIRAIGLLQPLLLRALPEGKKYKYRVVDGRRRFAALKYLERAVLAEGDYALFASEDESSAAFCANTMRQNLTLAEEVEQMSELAQKHTKAEIAQLLGRTPKYVALRLQLAKLSPAWKKVLADPEEYPQWNAAKLELIAREPEAVQEDFISRVDRTFSVAMLAEYLEEGHFALKKASFDVADCAKCQKRSGEQPELWEDEKKYTADHCLDKNCWWERTAKVLEEIIKTEKLTPIRTSGGEYHDELAKLASRFNAHYEWDYHTPKKGETANALVIYGKDVGKRVVIETSKADTAEEPAPPPEKREKTVAEREEELYRKRTRYAIQQLLEELRSKQNTPEEAAKRFAEAGRNLTDIIAHVPFWGFGGIVNKTCGWPSDWQKQMAEQYPTQEAYAAEVYTQICIKVRERLNVEATASLKDMNCKAGEEACALLELDWGAIFAKAVAELPEPKALQEARLKEQNEARKKERTGNE